MDTVLYGGHYWEPPGAGSRRFVLSLTQRDKNKPRRKLVHVCIFFFSTAETQFRGDTLTSKCSRQAKVDLDVDMDVDVGTGLLGAATNLAIVALTRFYWPGDWRKEIGGQGDFYLQDKCSFIGKRDVCNQKWSAIWCF